MSIHHIELALDEEMHLLKINYPAGTSVQFMIMQGQVNPSSGKVTGHRINVHCTGSSPVMVYPTLRVKHDQAKPGSRYPYRNVSLSDLV